MLHGSCLAPWLAGDEALSLVKLYCSRPLQLELGVACYIILTNDKASSPASQGAR